MKNFVGNWILRENEELVFVDKLVRMTQRKGKCYVKNCWRLNSYGTFARVNDSKTKHTERMVFGSCEIHGMIFSRKV